MTSPVAVVFVSTNEGNVLIPAIESLYASLPQRPLEVIVVDNDSHDGAAKEIARRWPEVQVLRREKNYGLPSNLNAGIRATVAPYVMLCNSDLIFGENSIDKLAEFLDNNANAGAVIPKLLSPEGEARPSARRWYTPMTLLALKGPWKSLTANWKVVKLSTYADQDFDGPTKVDWVPCPATMLRRDSLHDVGLMDERFRLYFDDVDICLRLQRDGWSVWVVPDAEVIHLEQRSSIRALSPAWRWHLISLFKFWWKHKGLAPKV